MRSAQHLHFLSYSVAREPNHVDWKSRNSFTVARYATASFGVLVCSTKLVDGWPRVLYLIRWSASWLNAQSLLLFISVTKKIVWIEYGNVPLPIAVQFPVMLTRLLVSRPRLRSPNTKATATCCRTTAGVGQRTAFTMLSSTRKIFVEQSLNCYSTMGSRS